MMSRIDPLDVAILGAAGQTGRPLVRALARRRARVRAVVHRREQSGQVPEAAVVDTANFDNVDDLIRVLTDVAVAYYIPPAFNVHEERFGANVIAAALAARLPRLVYHSVLHAATPAMPHHHRKAMVELALRDSALTWTIVQPAMYAQTPLAFLNQERTQITVGFDPTRLFTPVDLDDLADAVASVLLEDGHEYATYELAGAERLSFTDMVKTISRALGQEVFLRALPSSLVATVAATRFGVRALFDVKAMLDHYDAHGLVGNPRVLRMLLGREPRTFVDVMTRDLTSCGVCESAG
jgi:NAD(P)H dehydrogenase (quinone)